MSAALAAKLDAVPAVPGVYLWKNDTGQVIYVGKAKVLRHRVRQYFQRVEEKDVKTQLLVAHIADLDWIVTDSEKEALILEATLIKKYFPRYNVRLRDDKRFISLQLNLAHAFPRLYVVRRARHDGNLYFGPFSDARAIRETLRFINAAFLLRKCSDRNFATRTRPCLQYQIGRCRAPCVGYVDREAYAAFVAEVRLFFAGRVAELIPALTDAMRERAAQLDFEGAARLRDRIRAIDRSLEKQKVAEIERHDRDVFGLHREGAALVVCQLFLRGGILTGQRIYPFKDIDDDDGRVLRQLIGVYYTDDNVLPAQLLLPAEPEGGTPALAEFLTGLAGHRVEVRIARRGKPRQLVELAATNAQRHFAARRDSLISVADVLADLQHHLDLPSPPHTIECFDVSNVQGKQAVASQVRFTEGEPDKSGYRRYRIRTKDEPDDYAMLHEALTRRIKRGLAENNLPDLLLVDGGKGHLNVAAAALQENGVTNQPLASIAKIKDLAPGDPAEHDKIYLPGRKNPVAFRAGSHALHLLQRLRDEAHRFAIAYHRTLRGKEMTASVLDEIPGLGRRKKHALVAAFGSARRVAEADVAALAGVAGIGPRLARTIYDHLHAPC